LGVVLPAFLPTVSRLVANLECGDAVAIASSMSIGAQLTDVSSLGALCIVGAALHEDARALYNSLLAWGRFMSIGGGALRYMLFSVF
jgi:hypothetical protein